MKLAISQYVRQLRGIAELSTRCSPSTRRSASSTASTTFTKDKSPGKDSKTQVETTGEAGKPRKSVAELDEDMRLAMEGMAGDGGEAGLELEDGKATSMKRSVRENMFRYI
jgi:hypothetical protein